MKKIRFILTKKRLIKEFAEEMARLQKKEQIDGIT